MSQNQYYWRLRGNEIFYPEEVFAFEYQGIELFSSQDDDKWRTTEVKTGFAVSHIFTTREEAEQDAKDIIDKHTAKQTKKDIKTCISMIKQGMVYDDGNKKWVELTEWNTKDEQVNGDTDNDGE